MKMTLLTAAALLLSACAEKTPRPDPGPLVPCEGRDCYYDDGTEK